MLIEYAWLLLELQKRAKEALERKPAVEQRKQDVETRKQAIGEIIFIYITFKR